MDRGGRKRDPHHRRAQPCAVEAPKAGGARLLRGHSRIFGQCSCSLAMPLLRDASRQAIDIAWPTAIRASRSVRQQDCARSKVWRPWKVSRLARAAPHIHQRSCAISSKPNARPRTTCCRASHAFRICRQHGCCCCCCSFAQRLAPTTFSGLCHLTSPMLTLQCMMRPSHAASLLCSNMGKGPCHNTACAQRS